MPEGGYVFAMSQDGAGYYLPSSVNQAKAFYAQERKRADSIIKSLRGTSKFIKNSESKQREEMNGQKMAEAAKYIEKSPHP